MRDEELVVKIANDIGRAAGDRVKNSIHPDTIFFAFETTYKLHDGLANQKAVEALIKKGRSQKLEGRELIYYQSFQFALQEVKKLERINEISPDIAKRIIEKLHLQTLTVAEPKDNTLTKLGLFSCCLLGLGIGAKLSPYLFPRKQ